MVNLDGNLYKVKGTRYAHVTTKFGGTVHTITGKLSRTEVGSFHTQYKLTLLCLPADVVTLRASFAKTSTGGTPPGNLLPFTDEEGFTWLPGAGSNDANHAYNTGIYFTEMSEPRPVTELGWSTVNRFEVDVVLLPFATGQAG